MHARIHQRFHHQENISWTSRTERRCHVDLMFIFNMDHLAQRLEHGAHLPLLDTAYGFAGGPRGYPRADLGRRVGHGAHHQRMQ